MELENGLEKLGLNKQESKIYLASLKLGLAKASEIASKANINREASYYVLKKLQEKGYISEFIKSGVKYYSSASPKRLFELIEEDKNEKTRIIEDMLPNLEDLKKISLEQPKVEFFQGIEGIKSVVSKIFETKNQEICAYVPEKIFFLTTNTFSEQFRRKRKENNLKLKVITERTKLMTLMKKDDKKELRETRFNDIITKSDALCYILKDALIIIKADEKNQLGIYIKEESTAKLQRKIFEQMWKESKRT
ncbi:MAG: TrmB family transcriptional regulator [Candidatus Nanoarchaeia archaeon]